MRKPRDFDAELKALDQRAKALRRKQRDQLGELVVTAGAHQLPSDVLAGALLAAVRADVATKEAWRAAGVAYFRGERGGNSSKRRSNADRTLSDDRATQPAAGEASTS